MEQEQMVEDALEDLDPTPLTIHDLDLVIEALLTFDVIIRSYKRLFDNLGIPEASYSAFDTLKDLGKLPLNEFFKKVLSIWIGKHENPFLETIANALVQMECSGVAGEDYYSFWKDSAN